ncbi:hypothetical protein BGAL_0062g00080 [Botrytis galanthina]|uniref:Uncharacterized protein n=1 Tax=Botrytis galanthina TaxID=278940 RepID=A0A4S8R7R2_9HELO|nr:hypothetical protein BGAL_0062g00080 [Botrytis galanthina]
MRKTWHESQKLKLKLKLRCFPRLVDGAKNSIPVHLIELSHRAYGEMALAESVNPNHLFDLNSVRVETQVGQEQA